MPPLYLIDGYNFLHAVVLKGRERAAWWSPENQARAVSCIAELLAGERVETWVVFDRRDPEGEVVTHVGHEALPRPVRGRGNSGSSLGYGALAGAALAEAEGLQVHHAPDADDYIVALCVELCGLRQVIVVSADRSLVDRARYRGARGLSPWAFARADARVAAVDPCAGGSPE